MRFSPTCLSGFTLVELLVVVAVIVGLLAMLAPAMNKAMTAAEIAVCGSNNKQIVNACVVYATDNGRRLPGGNFNRNGNDPNYAGWGGPPAPAWAHIWLGVIGGYTLEDAHKVLYCPSMMEVFNPELTWSSRDANGSATTWQWGYAYFGQYAHNWETSGTWASRLGPPRKLTDRSHTPVVGDVTRGILENNSRFQATPASWVWIAHSLSENGANSQSGITSRPESDDFMPIGINNGMLDGSVTFFRYAPKTGGDLNYAIQLGGYPGFMWGKTPGSQVK